MNAVLCKLLLGLSQVCLRAFVLRAFVHVCVSKRNNISERERMCVRKVFRISKAILRIQTAVVGGVILFSNGNKTSSGVDVHPSNRPGAVDRSSPR